MTVKTTLSFTDRHHRFLIEKVAEGVFASQSAVVAAAVEQMIREEEERAIALQAMAEEIRARLQTPASEYVDQEAALAAARAFLSGTSASE
jgi:antitoxin ParD1/3/4